MTPAVSEKVTNNYFNLFAEKASGICHPSRAEENAIIVQSHYGTIFSPDYPVPYQNDTTCVWRLYAADGDRVRLRFVDFELVYPKSAFFSVLFNYFSCMMRLSKKEKNI